MRGEKRSSMGLMFQRYTEQARRAIYFARHEAQMRREAPISASHLLVGLTWDSDTRAERVAGLRTRAVEFHAIAGLAHFPTTASPYSSKTQIALDDDSKKTLAYAAEEAERDRQFWIDTDHLLRGMLRFPNSIGEALTNAGFELKQLRVASEQDRRENPPKSTPKWPVINLVWERYKCFSLPVLLIVLAALLLLVVTWMGPVR